MANGTSPSLLVNNPESNGDEVLHGSALHDLDQVSSLEYDESDNLSSITYVVEHEEFIDMTEEDVMKVLHQGRCIWVKNGPLSIKWGWGLRSLDRIIPNGITRPIQSKPISLFG